MEEFVQFSAKNKSEAITKACMEFGTSSDQLDIRIVSEGSSGFFGIGAKPAVIKARRKVTVKEEDEIKEILENVTIDTIRKTEKKDTAKKDNRKQDKKPAVKEKAQAKENKPAEEKKEAKKEEPKKEAPVKKEKKEAPVETKKKEEAPSKSEEEIISEPVTTEIPETENTAAENSETKDKNPRSRHGRDRNRKKHDRAGEKPEKTEESEVSEQSEESEDKEIKEKPVRQSKPVEILTDEEEIKDVENRAADFLRKIFDTIDLGEVNIKSEYNSEEGCLDVDIEGEDMGVLIGKRGQTLDSLQYLTSLVVNKGKDKYVRVKVDTEDYRRRRKETLENLAKGIAYKVKKTRRPVVLEPMNPYERRIIHSALQGSKYVETVSEGEEPYRHIVVKLKRY